MRFFSACMHFFALMSSTELVPFGVLGVFFPCFWVGDGGGSLCLGPLVYRASSRITMATQRKLCFEERNSEIIKLIGK